MKLVSVSVINDLSTDQRVARTCSVLQNQGFEVLLIGRKLKNSLSIERDYKIKRLKFAVNKGFVFYFCYNFRLFWYLLFKKVDIFFANDLDTLLANGLLARIKRKPLIYDSHEFFVGVPELQDYPFKKAVWRWVEKINFGRINDFITVNDSIAELYEKQYKGEINVVRNVPQILSNNNSFEIDKTIFQDKFVVVMQGAGINVNRGYEEAVLSMQYLENVLLLIIGSGDVIDALKEMSKTHNLESKVKFLDKMPYPQMMAYTRNANVGMSLDKATSINYELSLPNKLFDYIQAQIPIISTDIKEVAKIINQYNIGIIVPNHEPKQIAQTIDELRNNEERYNLYKSNTQKAAQELNWDNEKKVLEKILKKYA